LRRARALNILQLYIRYVFVSPAAAETLAPRFGRYEIKGLLGRGGMGEVLRARFVGPAGVEREVALKRVRPDLTADPRFSARLVEEARLAARLVHPNLVTLLEFGREGDSYFLAFELVEGADLRSAVAAAGPPPAAALAYIGREVARALAFLHRGGGGASGAGAGGASGAGAIVHGDVKPGNVLVGVGGVVKLADLGVARAAGAAAAAAAGATGATSFYVAPGSIARALTPADDRYALGLTLVETATGAHPRGADLDAALLLLPEPLRAVVTRLLAPPERAWTSGEELLEALDRAVHALGEAGGVHAEAEAARWIEGIVRAFAPGRRTDEPGGTTLPARAGAGSTELSALETAAGPGPAEPAATAARGGSGEKVNAPPLRRRAPPARLVAIAAAAIAAGALTWIATRPAVRTVTLTAAATTASAAAAPRPATATGPRSASASPPATSVHTATAAATASGSATARPRATGTLSLNVNGTWARVEIDAKDYGETPLTNVPLAAGVHRIFLFNPETKRTLKLTVTIKAGEHLDRGALDLLAP
jgi:hypothetical protein